MVDLNKRNQAKIPAEKWVWWSKGGMIRVFTFWPWQSTQFLIQGPQKGIFKNFSLQVHSRPLSYWWKIQNLGLTKLSSISKKKRTHLQFLAHGARQFSHLRNVSLDNNVQWPPTLCQRLTVTMMSEIMSVVCLRKLNLDFQNKQYQKIFGVIEQ